MTLPHVPQDPPDTPTFTFDSARFWPAFGLGWLLGALLLWGVRTVGLALLTSPCEGRTLLALAVPLLLGPGGLAFAALSWRHPHRSALGLGLMLASLLPGLYVGARDIGALRGQGCAGGYIVISRQGQKSVADVALRQGQEVQLTGRIGGYTPQTHPGLFTLKSESEEAGIVLTLPKTQVRAGETFPVRLQVGKSVPLNTYKAGVQASVVVDGKMSAATGIINIQVLP